MSREEAIKTLLEGDAPTNLEQKVDDLTAKVDLLLSVIVVQQKDACEAVGISPDTVRNKVLSGDAEVLQRDGSRLNFLTLTTVGELKVRRKAKRRR